MGNNIELKDNIRILRATETRTGNGEMTRVWKTISILKGYISDYSGNERRIDDRKEVYANGFLLLPLGTVIYEKDRIYCETTSKNYEVIWSQDDSNSVRKYFLRVELRYI